MSTDRHNIAVFVDAYEKLKKRYDGENTDKKFVKWVSDYLLINLEKDEFLSKYAPNITKIGITDNILYLKDSKKNKVVEIRMKDGKLQSNDEDDIYLHYAMALPELVYLKGNK